MGDARCVVSGFGMEAVNLIGGSFRVPDGFGLPAYAYGHG
jgi:hypothetical protein